ncbi:hypothetical protein LCGC14_0529060 [marine sediment metagenome]|uniref:DUF7192 domain-containing protein n=1 Tax=marine sediment metagenome TaxID=412755 RepID=A0A0F9SEG5_9ZZZZ
MKEHIQEFDSVQDWLKFLATKTDMPTSQRSSQEVGDRHWAGTATYAEALHLAERGWPEGVDKVHRMAVELSDKIIKKLNVPELVYDVVGDELDIGRYVEGDPEDFMTLTAQEEWQEPKILHVVANIGASAMVEADTMLRKGAAVVALVDALEQHGKRVIIDIVATATSGDRQIVTTVRIKDADAPVQLANLVFLIAHAASPRRLMFSAWEHAPETVRRAVGVFPMGGYGSPSDPAEDKRGDIYIGSLYGGWEADEAEAWVLKELGKQGIEIEGGRHGS